MARRAADSGTGPTDERAIARFPGAHAAFALFGEVLMIGLLAAVVALPIVTLPAALAGATRHLRRHLRAEDSRLRLFWGDVRMSLAGGTVIGAILLVAVLVLILDIDLARSGALPGGPLVEAVGWSGIGFAAVTLLAAAAAWEPGGGWRAAVRGVPKTILSDVRGALYLLSACVFVVVITWALPPLIIAGIGCAAFAAVAIPERPGRSSHLGRSSRRRGSGARP